MCYWERNFKNVYVEEEILVSIAWMVAYYMTVDWVAVSVHMPIHKYWINWLQVS